MIIFLTCWGILMAFFGAICVASGKREKAECQALMNMGREASEPEYMEVTTTPERSIGDLSLTLKSV
jgi:hypothetical protein